MTAEVAILNRAGVALAADSAVTIGRSATKIWTSADKLFQLSEADPVGVMIYGNADHVDMPWETVIKAYRTTRGGLHHPTVADHANDFLSFLGTAPRLFPKNQQLEHAVSLCTFVLVVLRSELAKVLDREAETRDGLDEDDVRKVVSDFVRNQATKYANSDYLPGYDREFRDSLRQKLRKKLAEVRKYLFGDDGHSQPSAAGALPGFLGSSVVHDIPLGPSNCRLRSERVLAKSPGVSN